MVLNMYTYSTLLVFYWMLLTSLVSAITIEKEDKIVPVSSYRTPKNVAFGSLGGGSSHQLWVLEILEEMYNRGHQVSFYTKIDQFRFTDDYPMISSKEVGGLLNFLSHPLLKKEFSAHPKLEYIAMSVLEVSMINYTDEFWDFTEKFKNNDINLVVCDSFAISCIDSAMYNKIPVIITSTFGISADSTAPYINNKLYDSAAPTNKYESIWTRIKRNYIVLPWLLRSNFKKVKEQLYFQRSLGLENTMDMSSTRYNNVPKIHSNVFGIEASRKLSPLVNLIGPVLRKSYPKLDLATKDFLDAHKKVVYIAFGQNIIVTIQDITMIVHGLLRLLEENIIDGIVWSQFPKDQLPSIIQTQNYSYSYQNITSNPDIRLMNWAPQFGILQHPSIEFFISHGGVTSLHEALYSRVRLLLFPFFGDQNGNAKSAKNIGVAEYFDAIDIKYDTASYESFFEKLYNVAVDPENSIQQKVNQYSAYIQIAASGAVRRGADLLEESLFASNSDGILDYRRDVGYDIHWFKRNNLDVYSVIVIFNLVILKISFDIWDKLWMAAKIKL